MISKKKGLHPNSDSFLTNFRWDPQRKLQFVVQITASPSQLLIANPIGKGGAIFIFGAKIGLKSTKNVIFCMLFRPMEGLEPPGYATGWTRQHKARGQGQGHKKTRGQLQGQGRPFRGQTLSRPRTKDTGASVLKKRSSKFFFRRSSKEENKKSSQIFREVSVVFLHYFKNEQIKCTSHYMAILRYKLSRR